MRTKGSKNLKTRIEEIEFEMLIVKEKLKMIDEFQLATTDLLKTYKDFFERIVKILEKIDEVS